jgi:uncharacterized protein YndB with AHSA1/START domain
VTVTDIHKDPETRTMTIHAEFDASIDAVWQMWENPRRLERWWGPPTYPATVVDHDLRPGGTVTYFMTSPEGDRYHGWWLVRSVDAPTGLDFEDGFADDEGKPNPDLPTTVTRVNLTEASNGTTRMAIETVFPSVQAMEQLVAMGMEEGITAALGQIDDLLRSETTSS